MPRKYSHEIAASPHAACCGSIVKDQEYPEGLGRIAGLVVCRVSHAPSLTVSKTGKTAMVFVRTMFGMLIWSFIYRHENKF